jgi:hypothetical protein
VPDLVRLTVVESQGESDVICSFLQVEGIPCSESGLRVIGGEGGSPYGGSREIFVSEADLERAVELLNSRAET